MRGKTLAEARAELEHARVAAQAELDQLTQKVVADGLASWSGGDGDERRLIVRGQAHLLEDLKVLDDLERVRLLFDDLDGDDASGEHAPEDDLLDRAIDVVRLQRRASISLLQRRLRIGYTRAARLIDLMQEKGIVGPAEEGSRWREVLVDAPR